MLTITTRSCIGTELSKKNFLENKGMDMKDGVINKLSVMMAHIWKIALEYSQIFQKSSE